MLDVTSTWAAFQQHRQKAGAVLAGILLFLAGWQLGRVTSPYYASHPIVFQEQSGESCGTPGGSVTELKNLEQAGVALASPKPKAAAVAGASTTAQGEYVASVNSTLYHHVSCPAADRIKPENRLWFATAQEAEDAGLSPSACAREKAGKTNGGG